MAKKLIIAEKPSVAGAIADALGGFKKAGECYERDDLIVSWAFGHLIRLNAPAQLLEGKGLSALPIIPDEFVLEVPKESSAPFRNLNSLMSRGDVDGIINACDAGREGELIFRLIYEKAKCRKPMFRMWLRTMTAAGIVEAYDDLLPGSQFNALSDAAKSRSEADWLIGINASRGLTQLITAQRGQWSPTNAGRVQTPTAAIVVYRERAIRNFVPRDYWEVHATFALDGGRQYTSKWVRQVKSDDELPPTQINTLDEASAIVARCQGATTTTVVDEAKASTKSAPSLYDVTTLQREANRRYGFSSKKTLDIAQSLYEKHKATTYPRTDATALPEDYVDTAKSVLASLSKNGLVGSYAQQVLASDWCKPNKAIFNNSKISDHFAIVPTGLTLTNGTDDELKIYNMIAQRFVAVFFPAAEFLNTTRISTVGPDVFRVSGTVMVSAGWKAVYGADSDDETADDAGGLCALKAGEHAKVADIKSVGLKTKPPKRFTEDTLLGAMVSAGKDVDDDDAREAMKGKGLGTGATRAATIEGLLSTKAAGGAKKVPFLERQKAGKDMELVPTDKLMTLVEDCEKNQFDFIISPVMTGEWEFKLGQIERGEYSRSEFMRGIATQVRSFIDQLGGMMQSMPSQAVEAFDAPCPKCGKALESNAKAISCSAKCGFTLWRSIASVTLTDEQAKALITTHSVGPIDGFISTKGNAFSAKLALDLATFKATFVFEDKPAPPLNTIEGKCPKCASGVALKAGDWPAVVCVNACGFKFYTTVAERKLSSKEIQTLLSTHALPSTHGYKGKGKPFTAGLKFKPDFSGVTFVFENS